ncbi:MAG: 3-deoxy-D-manno-octulosonic acid transferase [Planctomycetota bacterium]|jgi:3-deoxy-D-manno-octulosonic-acid transferase
MGVLIDAAYVAAAVAAAPVLAPKWLRRSGGGGLDLSARLGHGEPLPERGRRRILIHGVSVGEIGACRELVRRLEGESPEVDLAIAATTPTGLRRAIDLYEPPHTVLQYPFDLSAAVERMLDRVRPDVVATIELEIWPHLVSACRRREIPIVVLNGRLSPRSYRGYRRVRRLVAPMFRGLDLVLAQDQAYADRFAALGVPEDRIEIAGSMKWDAARIEDAAEVEAARELGEALGIDPGRPLVVAGSTALGEPEMLVSSMPSGVQLLCAPRRPEWWDAAEAAMPGCVRRSRGARCSPTGRYLLDTLGELRAAYALADVVVVGRSFGRLHGSDPVEPVALGKATVVGPSMGDFASTVGPLRDGGGVVATDREGLPENLRRLLADADLRRSIAEAGRRVIACRQGASARAAEALRARCRFDAGTHEGACGDA